jgi:tRNA A-37 threonylcarbamoyl transferase component Bud32
VAIRSALEDQLGLVLMDVQPFNLEGSGGSTPLRIKVKGDPPTYLFGKLYAANHLRADRWYKLGRTLLYGRLEDEARFTTVRQLVQFEDYMLRLMQDAGLPTPEPYGFVEITPEREYLLVTEFVTNAVEIGHSEIDDAVIDQGLDIVRHLWDAGLAHRDLKPSNLLVRDRELLLIDVAFGEVRPSPWRQAVDLANMMMVLALKSTPERVYERAVVKFTPEEIAEGFAASRSVTMPTQLRQSLREDGRDLLAAFRRLAPPLAPISIQRWSVRRIALLASIAFGALLVLLLAFSGLQNAKLL